MHTITLIEELDVNCTFTAKHIPLLHSLMLVKCLMPNECNSATSKHTEQHSRHSFPRITSPNLFVCTYMSLKKWPSVLASATYFLFQIIPFTPIVH